MLCTVRIQTIVIAALNFINNNTAVLVRDHAAMKPLNNMHCNTTQLVQCTYQMHKREGNYYIE